MECSKLAKSFDLLKYAYAHRGLWRVGGPAENSIVAYTDAAAAGLGLEFDVRPSVDGVPVCFHDQDLSRVTHHEGYVSDYTADALTAFQLQGGGKIPLLAELLAIWPHELPLLVEMKIDGETDPSTFTNTVAEQISNFPGLAAMMSFSETAVASVPSDIMRGQLIKPSASMDDFNDRLERSLVSGAEFIGLHVSDAAAGAGKPLPCVCWTVRNSEQRQVVQSCGHAEIFEHLPIPLAAP